MKNIMIVICLILLIGCNSTLRSNGPVVDTIKASDFTLNQEATFRTFSKLKMTEYDKSFLREMNFQDFSEIKTLFDKDVLNSLFMTKVDGGNSLTTDHSKYRDRIKILFKHATIAYKTKDAKLANLVIDVLYRLAANDSLLKTINAIQAQGKPCWKNGNAYGECYMHHAQTAAAFFTGTIHSTIFVKQWLVRQPDKKQVIDKWLAIGFQKYIKSLIGRVAGPINGGLYQLMNGKSGVLIYAIYTNNSDLFFRYANKGISQINQLMNAKGLIYNNSWRGTRSVFYHNLGVDVVFGFGELLEAQGIEFYNNPKIKNKLRKAYLTCMTSTDDPIAFEKKGFRGNNHTKKESEARRGWNGDARGVQWIGSMRYPDIGQKSLPFGWDDINQNYPILMWGDLKSKLKGYVWKTRLTISPKK